MSKYFPAHSSSTASSFSSCWSSSAVSHRAPPPWARPRRSRLEHADNTAAPPYEGERCAAGAVCTAVAQPRRGNPPQPRVVHRAGLYGAVTALPVTTAVVHVVATARCRRGMISSRESRPRRNYRAPRHPPWCTDPTARRHALEAASDTTAPPHGHPWCLLVVANVLCSLAPPGETGKNRQATGGSSATHR